MNDQSYNEWKRHNDRIIRRDLALMFIATGIALYFMPEIAGAFVDLTMWVAR
jgi:hypothetical protein